MVGRQRVQVSPSEARSAGMEDALRGIGTLDARLAEMKDDYSSMCDVHNAELRTLEAKAAACAPRGVEQACTPPPPPPPAKRQHWLCVPGSVARGRLQ